MLKRNTKLGYKINQDTYFSLGMENQYSGFDLFLVYDSMGHVFDTVLFIGTPIRRHRYNGGSSNCAAGFGTKSVGKRVLSLD